MENARFPCPFRAAFLQRKVRLHCSHSSLPTTNEKGPLGPGVQWLKNIIVGLSVGQAEAVWALGLGTGLRPPNPRF